MLELIKSGKSQNLVWFGVATLIFAALFWIAEPGKILTALKEANLRYLFLSVIAGFAVITTWTLNWFNFFRVSGIDCSFPRTFQLFSAGQLLNSITPLGQFGGQPFMAYLISKHSDTSYEKSLATVMSADVLAIIPLSTFVILGYSYIVINGAASSHLTKMSAIASSLLIFGIVMSYLGWYRPGSLENALLTAAEAVTGFIGRGSGFVEGLEKRLENVEETFRTVGNSPEAVIRSLAIAHAAFLFKMAAFYGVMMSIGIQMNFFQVMLLIPLASVANFSPTPGGAGTFEAVMAGIINLFAPVEFAIALTAAVLYRISTYWLTIVVGYLAINSLNYRFNDFRA